MTPQQSFAWNRRRVRKLRAALTCALVPLAVLAGVYFVAEMRK